MKKSENIRERILDQSSYWVESVNGYLYDAIINYMKENNLKQKDLASHLGISTSRVSQILNDGEINYSLDKLIHFGIQVGYYPDFKFIEKKKYLEKEEKCRKVISFQYNPEEIWEVKHSPNNGEKKIINLEPITAVEYQDALEY